MTTEQSPRDLVITTWYLNDILGHKGQIPTPEVVFVYAKALIEVASADGILSEEERKWIIGFAAVFGASQDKLDQLKVYEPGNCTGVQHLFQDIDLTYARASRLSIIYNGFRAAGADGELHSKEIEAIHALAKKLELTDEQIEQVRQLTEEDEKLRQKRTKVLFPEGYDDLLTHLKKQYS